MSDESDGVTLGTPPEEDDVIEDDDDEEGHCKTKRARKAAKLDQGVRLEKSRQSARECRVRKKLRYQYLEELVQEREKAIYALRRDLDKFRNCCRVLDRGELPTELVEKIGRDRLIEIITSDSPGDENGNMSQHMQQRQSGVHGNGLPPQPQIPQLSHTRLQMPSQQQHVQHMHLMSTVPNGAPMTMVSAPPTQQGPLSACNYSMGPGMTISGPGPSAML